MDFKKGPPSPPEGVTFINKETDAFGREIGQGYQIPPRAPLIDHDKPDYERKDLDK